MYFQLVLSNNGNVDELMDWDSISEGYFDSRENSECSFNSEEEFEQQSLEQNEERLYFTMQESDHDSKKGSISNSECASLYNSDYSDTHSEDSSISDNDGTVFEDFVDDGGIFQTENFEHINSDRKPLYEGCDITREESELLIMTYAMRFGLSDIALQSLIDLIDCHLPRQEHKSLHLLIQKFPKPPNIITHFFCSSCKNIVNFLEASKVICNCGLMCVMDDLKSQQCFFIQIPLQDQLIRLLQDDRIHSMLQEGFISGQSDVHSGEVYKRLVQDGIISVKDLTLQWNTDGVQIFKSSKVSLWPIQVAVNNLPFQARKENILLCGLWYGSKPDMNIFLKPFVEELSMLHNEGLEYVVSGSKDKAKVKVHTLIASVDSQARPLLQKLKTFRGKQGCSFCLNEGEEYEVGRGKARIYRGDIGQLRTHEQHVQDTKTVMQTGKVKNGIKDASVLLLLPLFNIITSFVPDYMHCILLGVVKTMVEWWKNGENKKEPFYIGSDTKLKQIDAILSSIKPPSEITRTPRSITECKLWKASEWKNFLLYYSLPCLHKVGMPKKYIDHWFLLIYSVHVFLREKISPEDFSIAERSIRQFVLNIEDVYNAPQLMKFNIHLLLHIPKSVKQFGGLWAVSCFPYEHYNGTLGKMFRSSQAVPQQICKFYLRLQSLKEKGAEVFSSNNNALFAKSLYETLTFRKLTSNNCIAYGEHIRLFGKPDYITLTLTQKVAVENFLKEEIQNQQIRLFRRFIYKNILFHVEGYERMKRRINNIVRLQNKTVVSISHALIVKTLQSNQMKCILLGIRLHLINDTVCQNRSINVSSNIFCSIMEMTPECVAIFPEMIQCKCVVTPYDSKLCVYPLINSLERD